MHADVLVAEIGSTITVVSAFNGVNTDHPVLLGQGSAPTSVDKGDVTLGLDQAVDELTRLLGCAKLEYEEFLAASSAAGGLRMTVHGLVYEMTVKAAQAAALGAGAVLMHTTAGKLLDQELEHLKHLSPKLVILAGGTDYGERETALYNAERLAHCDLTAPVVYAGNVQNQQAVKDIFGAVGKQVFVTENVYPKLDVLNIEPARRIIHQAFAEHIVQAPGMERIRERINGEIMPTPGAVMELAQLLYQDLGDLAVIDVGGATTDVHSVTPGSEEVNVLQVSPEPLAKRTVEGDLGIYVNGGNVIKLLGAEQLAHDLQVAPEQLTQLLSPVPQTQQQLELSGRLCAKAAMTALLRHVGTLRYVYTPSGRHTIAEGKDLSQIKTLIATGGALTRLPQRQQILDELSCCNKTGMLLFPKPGNLELAYDNHYIMASLGVMSKRYPQASIALMKRSFANAK